MEIAAQGVANLVGDEEAFLPRGTIAAGPFRHRAGIRITAEPVGMPDPADALAGRLGHENAGRLRSTVAAGRFPNAGIGRTGINPIFLE